MKLIVLVKKNKSVLFNYKGLKCNLIQTWMTKSILYSYTVLMDIIEIIKMELEIDVGIKYGKYK